MDQRKKNGKYIVQCLFNIRNADNEYDVDLAIHFVKTIFDLYDEEESEEVTQMKTFEEWLKANGFPEMPGDIVPMDWFVENGLPMIVECSCCGMSMCIANALIDDEGNVYCSSCGAE